MLEDHRSDGCTGETRVSKMSAENDIHTTGGNLSLCGLVGDVSDELPCAVAWHPKGDYFVVPTRSHGERF